MNEWHSPCSVRRHRRVQYIEAIIKARELGVASIAAKSGAQGSEGVYKCLVIGSDCSDRHGCINLEIPR